MKDLPAPQRQQTHQRLEQRGFTRAVRSHHRHLRPVRHLEGQVAQNRLPVISRADVFQLQARRFQAKSLVSFTRSCLDLAIFVILAGCHLQVSDVCTDLSFQITLA